MFSSTFNLQVDLRIDGQDISSGEIIRERTYFFPININSHYYVLQKTKSVKTKSQSTIVNGNVNLIYYDSKDVLPPCSRSILYNDYSTLSTLHIQMKEHDNRMNEKNRIESI